ncbi:hypothetical protein B0H16DRAFT_1713447 [Mycena metata]|uniref:CxC2-like cysteine cluster KDZ transposase-associated domain-containing protein n=1 Tax=Mycena metata TaxID=1033252 RepID=A0AAD7NUC4_9AGAR|nr:hypothetical protein B0H16DRAFT_1713447 [Mycena metata]
MYIHQPSVATTYEQSADGRRVLGRSSAVDTSTPAVPAYYAVDKEMEEALEQTNFSYLCGAIESWDDAGWEGEVPPEVQEADSDGITLRVGGQGPLEGVHFERWEAGDTPMKVFVRNHRNETLEEMLRLEGRGSPDVYRECAECKSADPLYRCARQTCISAAMYCEACIVKLHCALPTHLVEMWTGQFFVPLSLNDLGLEARIQLGHPPGVFCPRSRPTHKDFVIIDVLGIRVVKLSFCGCDSRVEHWQQLRRACLWPATSVDPQTCAITNAIRLFEMQNCLGKISAYDFVRSLELLSNNDGMETVRKREVDAEGKQEKAPPDRRRAFRAIMRQYRMMELFKRAARGHDDSGVKGTRQGELAEPRCRLCPIPKVNIPADYDTINWEEEPEDQRYKYFLELAQDANFKLINRNVSTEESDPIVDDGAGFFCNRKEYAEHIGKHVDEEEISSCSGFQAMFLANTKRIKGLRVTGIGGVTCARHNMWRPNGIGDLQMGERYCNMDFLFFSALLGYVWMYVVLSTILHHLWWAVRNFHLPAHKKGCHSPFSFHWLWGAGRTHGETVEQNWEFLNGIAVSTKMMGLGARHTALEGLFSFHNWWRLVAHRMMLKEIRILLAAEEYAKTGDGTEVEREDTPSTFGTMGMEIEEAQQQLAVAIKAAGPTPSPTQELDFLKRRSSLRMRLQAFRKLQLTYMPKL